MNNTFASGHMHLFILLDDMPDHESILHELHELHELRELHETA